MPPRGRGGRGATATAPASRSLLSGKAKKAAMKEKREKERVKAEKTANWEKREASKLEHEIHQRHHANDSDNDSDDASDSQNPRHHDNISDDNPLTHSLPPSLASTELSGDANQNRLRTVFAKESKAEIEKQKLESFRPLRRKRRLNGELATPENYWDVVIDIPMRPQWSASDSTEILNNREARYFTDWLTTIYSKYNYTQLNHFEHNLEVWRQLWRVCERSDILLLIVDARFPIINFSPSLYDYIVKKLAKPMIVVLNKIDLVPNAVLSEWKEYFHRLYPSLHVIAYSSKPKSYSNPFVASASVNGKNKTVSVGGGMTVIKPYGADELLAACKTIVANHSAFQARNVSVSFEPTSINQLRNISAPASESKDDSDSDNDSGDDREEEKAAARRKPKKSRTKIGRKGCSHTNDDNDSENDGDSNDTVVDETIAKQFQSVLGRLDDDTHTDSKSNTSATATTSSASNFITIGSIGTPNAGKSSLINSLAGYKLVSVSATPGHTKYLQTLFLNPTVRLADCPGLVFPCLNQSKGLQLLAGQFPIAQARNPYDGIRILAEILPLETIYKLRPVPNDERSSLTYDVDDSDSGWQWTAYSVCESFAYLKGFRNRHGVLDSHRAANFLLREALDGKIIFYSVPPGHLDTDAAGGGSIDSTSAASARSDSGQLQGQSKKKAKKSRRHGSDSESDDNLGDAPIH